MKILVFGGSKKKFYLSEVLKKFYPVEFVEAAFLLNCEQIINKFLYPRVRTMKKIFKKPCTEYVRMGGCPEADLLIKY